MKMTTKYLILVIVICMWTSIAKPNRTELLLDSVDEFLVKQMNVFGYCRPSEQPALVQTFGWDPNLTFPPADLNPPPCNEVPCAPAPLEHMLFRGDTYDQALAALCFVERARLDHINGDDPVVNLLRAKELLDAVIFLKDYDPIPDGRIRMAYWANNLLNPTGTESSIMDPSTGIGNMSWCGIALTRFYYVAEKIGYLNRLERQQYLNTAIVFANWIIDNCEDSSWPYGYTGGYDDWSQIPYTWKSTEHNIDVFTFARNLQQLDDDPNWINMAYYSGSFVRNMFNSEDGYYYTGTLDDGITPNPSPVPADGQSWSACSSIDQISNIDRALEYLAVPGMDPNVLDDLLVLNNCCSQTFFGIKFSNVAVNIQNEVTAGAAIAFYLTGRYDEAQQLLNEIDLIRQSNCRTNDGIEQGIGIVATPCLEGAWTGYGDSAWYYNLRHVASTAWTGLAAMVLQNNEMANPLKSLLIEGDFNKDYVVNLADHALFSQSWQESDCDSGYFCNGMDIDLDGSITLNDYISFIEHWLEKIN